MRHDEFRLHGEFTTMEGARRWRVTDIGSRVVVAIRVDEARMTRSRLGPDGTMADLGTRVIPGTEAQGAGLFSGPPYGVVETVFDEYDMPGCDPARD